MGGPIFSFDEFAGGGTSASTTYTGTTDQVIVTGTVLSTPQSINTTNCVRFLGLGIGTAGCTNTLKIATNGIIDFGGADLKFTHAAGLVQLSATNTMEWKGSMTGAYWALGPSGLSSSTYVLASNGSNTLMNAATGSTINLRVNNADIATVAATPGLALVPAQITAGSGTGVTVVAAGHVRTLVYKVRVSYTALAAADVVADKVIATLPKKTRLTGVIADTTVPYTGGAVSAATMVCGNGTTGDDCSYLASIDVLSATSTKGLLDGDLGTQMTRAAAIQGGCIPSWSLTGPINIRITTTGANTNALTAGCTEFYLVTETLDV